MDIVRVDTSGSDTPTPDYVFDNENEVFFTPASSPQSTGQLLPATQTATSPETKILVAECLQVPLLSIPNTDFLRHVRQVPLARALSYPPSEFQTLTESAREQFLATAFKDLRIARSNILALTTYVDAVSDHVHAIGTCGKE
jgi:hypothetical protein